MSYKPEKAEVPIAAVVIRFPDQDEHFVMKWSAIAKYPYLSVTHSNLEFGSLIVG